MNQNQFFNELEWADNFVSYVQLLKNSCRQYLDYHDENCNCDGCDVTSDIFYFLKERAKLVVNDSGILFHKQNFN